MRRIIILAIFLCIVIKAYPQNRLPIIDRSITKVGSNYISNKPIEANIYDFKERIQNIYIDTNTKLLSLELRDLKKDGKYLKNKGKYVIYNMNNNNVRWSNTVNYLYSSIYRFQNIIIKTSGGKSSSINIYNGEELWQICNGFYFINSKNNIALGYGCMSENMLEGIDLSNRESLWSREINREYGWNDTFYLNDSVVMIVAAGLHTVNLNTGEGWDFNTITGKKDYSGTAAANAAGLALGALTGSFVLTTGYSLLSNIASNVVIDSSKNVFFASKLEISSIDKSGKVLWSNPFINNLPSKSSLFIKDSMLYMLNRGYAMKGYKKVKYGDPFFAAFNKCTGKKNFMTSIENDNMIYDYRIISDNILIVQKNRLSIYSLITGDAIKSKDLNPGYFGNLGFIINNTETYLKEADSTFTNLQGRYPKCTPLYSDSQNIIMVNSNLEVDTMFNVSKLWYTHINTSDYKFISNKNYTYLINGNNEIISKVDITNDAFIVGRKLYDIRESLLYEIDLEKVLE